AGRRVAGLLVAGDVAVAGEGVQHEDRVVAGFVQMAPRFVRHGHLRQLAARFELERTEVHELSVADGMVLSPRTTGRYRLGRPGAMDTSRPSGPNTARVRLGLPGSHEVHGIFY